VEEQQDQLASLHRHARQAQASPGQAAPGDGDRDRPASRNNRRPASGEHAPPAVGPHSAAPLPRSANASPPHAPPPARAPHGRREDAAARWGSAAAPLVAESDMRYLGGVDLDSVWPAHEAAHEAAPEAAPEAGHDAALAFNPDTRARSAPRRPRGAERRPPSGRAGRVPSAGAWSAAGSSPGREGGGAEASPPRPGLWHGPDSPGEPLPLRYARDGSGGGGGYPGGRVHVAEALRNAPADGFEMSLQERALPRASWSRSPRPRAPTSKRSHTRRRSAVMCGAGARAQHPLSRDSCLPAVLLLSACLDHYEEFALPSCLLPLPLSAATLRRARARWWRPTTRLLHWMGPSFPPVPR